LDPISRVDQVLLLLRQQLAGKAAGKLAGAAKGAEGSRQGPAAQPLQDVIARRLAELRSAGLTSRASLTRLLLEEVLTAQFGRQLLNDASFQRVVADIQSAIEEDVELRGALDSLLDESSGL
jgi:hypothetical protein